MVFNVADSCGLFSGAGCTGSRIDVFNGDLELVNLANYQFASELVSYKCYPQCPLNKKRGARVAAC